MIGAGDEEEVRFDWRRGGAAAAGLIAALVLVAMVFLVKFANDARERALAAERHAYEVALVVRNVSANMSRAEAALARFVLDEDVKPSGNIYASDWQLAGYQIDQLSNLMRSNPDQLRRVAELQRLYRTARRRSCRSPRAPLSPSRATRGSAISTQAATRTRHGHAARQQARRNHPQPSASRCATASSRARFFSEQADQRTDYLSWLGIIVGLGAIFLGVVAVQALRQNAAARRQARIRGRARRGARACRPRPHAGAVGGQPGAEAPKPTNARPPKRSFARSRRWRPSAS